jgi:hypothetical protein
MALSLTYVIDCSLVADALPARGGDDVLRQLTTPANPAGPMPGDIGRRASVAWSQMPNGGRALNVMHIKNHSALVHLRVSEIEIHPARKDEK